MIAFSFRNTCSVLSFVSTSGLPFCEQILNTYIPSSNVKISEFFLVNAHERTLKEKRPLKPLKGVVILIIFLIIVTLMYALHSRGPRRWAWTNHKQESCYVHCHRVIPYTRKTIAVQKNGPCNNDFNVSRTKKLMRNQSWTRENM